jgi:hypothetical protein
MIATEQAFTVLTKGLSAACSNSYETSRCIIFIFKETFIQVTNSNFNVEGNSHQKLVHLARITKYETHFTHATLNSELDSHYCASWDTYSTTGLGKTRRKNQSPQSKITTTPKISVDFNFIIETWGPLIRLSRSNCVSVNHNVRRSKYFTVFWCNNKLLREQEVFKNDCPSGD